MNTATLIAAARATDASGQRARPRLSVLFALTIGLAGGLAGCGVRVQQPLPPVALTPELLTAGERIYFGRVFALGNAADASSTPTFIYERRVSDSPPPAVAASEADAGMRARMHTRSTHITRDVNGHVAVAESAVHTAGYDLIDYQLYGDQLGQSGSVQVRGDRVRFLLHSAGGDRAAEEEQSAPVLVGPTLVGFIARQRANLEAGKVVALRLAVLERLETLGFELRRVSAAPGQTRVEMAASNPLIGWVVAPLYFTFDVTSGKLLRMEGRVPPKVIVGARWHDLDARVEYSYVAAAYR